jgi:uncharacterized protein (DUF362 family)
VASASIVKYVPGERSVARAIDLCHGLDGLERDHRVLIKPNVVAGFSPDRVPYGITTTPEVVEELITLLLEHRCDDIVIGEGPTMPPEFGIPSDWAFEWSGIKELAEKLGVELIDFNREEYIQTELGGERFWIAKRAIEADFLIDVPVLKTHSTTFVSLGLKNLKGCLNPHSKKKFHRKDLNGFIAQLGAKLNPDLVVIDGIYGLERGPMGRNHRRMDLIVASKDLLSADVVGSSIMGFDPSSIPHIREFAGILGRGADLGEVEIMGEKLDDVRRAFEWEKPWYGLVEKAGIEGITLQEPGTTVCTGCGLSVWLGMQRFFQENRGARFDAEFCIGWGPRAVKDDALLFGACAIATNRDLKSAKRLRGCPPTVEGTYSFIRDALL